MWLSLVENLGRDALSGALVAATFQGLQFLLSSAAPLTLMSTAVSVLFSITAAGVATERVGVAVVTFVIPVLGMSFGAPNSSWSTSGKIVLLSAGAAVCWGRGLNLMSGLLAAVW